MVTFDIHWVILTVEVNITLADSKYELYTLTPVTNCVSQDWVAKVNTYSYFSLVIPNNTRFHKMVKLYVIYLNKII